MASAELTVTVVYATAAQQTPVTVRVAPGSTVRQAIEASGVLQRFREIDLAHQALGIFGERAALTDPVRDGDRIEIYRRLLADPKEARRARAARRPAAAKPPRR
jgi:putative ubiquitin-RnfH superfamily antitoxin RatB of RatAB toxin-antitoxin module